ncbi:ATP-binding protein [Natronoglycomyces albus]|uniref:ATP-binding protein n=1 Tax=Natronoglycomyces albus TaxID=2811108 RepID=A0A895XRQ9_9ACTN|nr:ATP-binding protein [Natronoglycomyces albus]QSB06029.1 ATP-binding protein [Natronoglycomyces albus]
MSQEQLRALREVRISWAVSRSGVWDDVPHVPDINAEALLAIDRTISESIERKDPLGLPIVANMGAGKSHCLAIARQRIQRADGFFFILELGLQRDFWDEVRGYLVECLSKQHEHGDSQLHFLLSRLLDQCQVSENTAKAVLSGASLRADHVGEFVTALRRTHPHVKKDAGNTLAALAVYNCEESPIADVAESYLRGEDDLVTDRSQWHMSPSHMDSRRFAEALSTVLSLVGPTLLCADQFDKTTEESHTATGQISSGTDLEAAPLARFGNALMSVRETMSHTAVVLSCLPTMWDAFRRHAVATARHRFREPSQLGPLPSPQAAAAMVRSYLAPVYQSIGFTPPYSTWPVASEAFADAVEFGARKLLEVVQLHIDQCVESGQVVELNSILHAARASHPVVDAASEDDVASVEALFQRYRNEADISTVLDKNSEDSVVPDLLHGGVEAMLSERGLPAGSYRLTRAKPSRKPLGWHLQFSIDADDGSDAPLHWTIGFNAHDHGRAIINRINLLRTTAKVDPGTKKRRALLVATGAWSQTPGVVAALEQFKHAGGRFIDYEMGNDIRTLKALEQLERERPPGWQTWLRRYRPASATGLYREIFGEEAGHASPCEPQPEPDADPPQTPSMPTTPPSDPAIRDWTPFGSSPASTASSKTQQAESQAIHDSGIPLGYEKSGKPMTVPLETLRKHVAVFAGSGSGKTVLLRRLIEECALRGVSAIVVDSNNDLARLGQAWPTRPEGWLAGDGDRAERYLSGTEVLVWTPGRSQGRPLALQPLPDFRGIEADSDEFTDAVDSAMEVLAPRAGSRRATKDAAVREAVLRSAVAHFARRDPSGHLRAFIAMLNELPEGVVELAKAEEHAHAMAQNLQAATINDPLFGGSGTPLDPSELLSPAPGRRARVSVVNLVGLSGEEQRQHFVNQLQLAVFGWAKRHPATSDLGALFVLDEAQTFVPSGKSTPCTASTKLLASQARKYGLGLIFATQAPKGIDNTVVGNAATQYFGYLNSPTQIDSVKEMARSKTSDVLDISRLKRGEFYAGSEGTSLLKLSSPMCLSHHPPSAPSAETVLDIARRDR